MSRTEVRKKKKNRRTIIIVVLAVLVIVLAFLLIKSIVNSSDKPGKDVNPATGTEVTTNTDPVVPVKTEPEIKLNYDFSSLDDVTKETIVQFFNDYYKFIAVLEDDEFDASGYFADPVGISAAKYNTSVEYLAEVRKMQPIDLSMTSMRADLAVKKCSDDGEKIKVTIMEDTFMKFAEFNGLETEIYGIENNFTFNKATGKLTSYKKVQDFYILFQDAEGQTQLDNLRSKYIGLIAKKIEKRDNDKIAFESGAVEAKPADHEYNRQEASDYAKSYVNKRNKNYMALDGNNCQNFVSQVLRAGGMPDDHVSTGEYTTWYYNSASDFTTVWTYVPYFREYAKTNSGSGLVAKVDANWYTAEPGDVVEVGITGPTRHTTAIADVYYDENGNYVDALLSSNTLDMRNFPVTAYVYPYTSLVKVYGWND